MNSFLKFYHDANRNKTNKKKTRPRKYRMASKPITRIGIEDHKFKQNASSDPKTQDQPSSSVFMPKG